MVLWMIFEYTKTMENCTADFKKRRKTHKTKKKSGFNVLVNAIPVKPCGQV